MLIINHEVQERLTTAPNPSHLKEILNNLNQRQDTIKAQWYSGADGHRQPEIGIVWINQAGRHWMFGGIVYHPDTQKWGVHT